jgi:CBS domain-containing protein
LADRSNEQGIARGQKENVSAVIYQFEKKRYTFVKGTEERKGMKILSILSKKGAEVITIGPEASVQDSLKLLVKYNIGALVVIDENERLVGILSERDIIRRAVEENDIFSLPVNQLMTKEVVVCDSKEDLMSVAHMMTEKRFRHVPVVDGKKLVGIVSIGDILKAQRDQFLGEIDTLETQILARNS